MDVKKKTVKFQSEPKEYDKVNIINSHGCIGGLAETRPLGKEPVRYLRDCHGPVNSFPHSFTSNISAAKCVRAIDVPSQAAQVERNITAT